LGLRRIPGGGAGVGGAHAAETVKEGSMRPVLRAGAAVLAALTLPLQACTDHANVTGPGTPSAARVATPTYTSVTVGDETFEFWPYTTSKLSITSPDDPVNLLLVGEGDPRSVRAALMALPASPPPLSCKWTDAIGGEQASAAAGVGWTGSAIQLACGPFGPVRLHLRLFDIGDAVLVGAHFEVLLEGTDVHQVLSYSLAEDLVLYDLLRTGLVDQAGITLTEEITTSTQDIQAFIFNSLPDELQALVTGAPGDVAAAVPVPNGDGKVTVVPLAHYTGAGEGSYQEFTLPYDAGIPKPFCQAEGDWVYVYGPVQLAMTVTIAPDGRLERDFRAEGTLSITPIDPTTGEATGPSYRANVTQDQQAWATGTAHWVQSKLHQHLLPSGGADRGQISEQLRIGTDVPDDFSHTENCGGIGSQ
jgi:hypothetical protein